MSDTFVHTNDTWESCKKAMDAGALMIAKSLAKPKYVMTVDTLSRIKSKACRDEEVIWMITGGDFMSFPTFKECLDFMESVHEDKSYILVYDSVIPVDCLWHPFIVRQVNNIGSMYGF